ncbi:MAG: hypothetical protein V3W34_11165 [Phycisphaerae bacterium]
MSNSEFVIRHIPLRPVVAYAAAVRRARNTTIPADSSNSVIGAISHLETGEVGWDWRTVTDRLSPSYLNGAPAAAFPGLAACVKPSYNEQMVTIDGRLIDPRHVELVEPVPPGEDSIQVRLIGDRQTEFTDVALLTHNPAFDFLRDEPDLYE